MGSVPREVDLGRISSDFETAVVVSEGDTLVLVTDRRMSTDAVARGTAALQESIPGVKVVVVQGFQQALVYKPTQYAEAKPEQTDFEMGSEDA